MGDAPGDKVLDAIHTSLVEAEKDYATYENRNGEVTAEGRVQEKAAWRRQHEGHPQELRLDRGDPQHQCRDPRWRVRDSGGAVGMQQVHAVAHDRGPRSFVGRDQDRRRVVNDVRPNATSRWYSRGMRSAI